MLQNVDWYILNRSEHQIQPDKSLFKLWQNITVKSVVTIGYEPADLTVHPPELPRVGSFFCMGV